MGAERAGAFYQRCGVERVEELTPANEEPLTVLTKRLASEAS